MSVTVQATPVKVNIYVSGGNISSTMVNPMTTTGDIIYGGILGTPLRLPIGSNTQVLTSIAGLPIWAAASGGNFYQTIQNATIDLTQRTKLNVTNGLTALDNSPVTDVKLGGSLTDSYTLINLGTTSTLEIASTSFGVDFILNPATGVAQLFAGIGAVQVGFNLSSTLFSVLDNRATKAGMQYSADYSANYTARSLVDKNYVDTHSSLPGGSNTQLQYNNSGTFGGATSTYNNITGGVVISGITVSSAWTNTLKVVGAANIAYTAATEFIDIDFNLNRSITWIDGTVATQRQVYFRGATYNKTTTSATFTDAFTQYTDAPVAGTGVTITRNWAAGFNGNIWSSGQLMIAASGTSFTTAGTELALFRKDTNGSSTIAVLNATSGTLASSSIQIGTSAIGGGVNSVYLFGLSAGYTTSGILVANTGAIYSAYTGGLNLGTVTGQVGFWSNNLERARFLSSGEFLVGYTSTGFSEFAGFVKNANASTRIIIQNTTAGTAGQAQLAVYASATQPITLSAIAVGFTTSGINVANTGILSTSMTGGMNIGPSVSAQISLWTNSVKRVSIDANGNTTFTQGAQASAWGQVLTLQPGAHTSITAATELIDIDFQLNRNVQWLAGTVATQRQVYVRGVTLTGASATATFTNAYSLYIDPPVAGTNAIITNSFAAGFGGSVLFAAGTTTRPPIVIPAGTNLTTSLAGALENDGTHLWFTFANSGARWQLDNQVGTFGWSASGNTTITANTSQTGSFTNTFNLDGIVIAQNSLSAGSSIALQITQGGHTGGTPEGLVFSSLSSMTGLSAPINTGHFFRVVQGANRQYVTGNISNLTSSLIQTGTISFVGASTVTDAINLGVAYAPQASTNTSITNSHALYIYTTGVGSGVTNSYALTVNAMTGATNNYSAQFLGGFGVKFSQSPQSTTHTFVNIAQSAHTGGTPTGLLFTGGAHTGLTASAETNDVQINSARTVQFVTGNFALQRTILIQRATYAFVGASTITDAATLVINGAPLGGTNATLTNSHAVFITAPSLTNTTNGYGLTVLAPIGATNNYAAQFLSGAVGILTSAPVSSLEIAGSYGVNIATLSANTTLDATHSTVLVDATGAARTITLPTASGATRRIYRILKKDSSVNTVTISTTAGGNKVISTQYLGFVVQSDGTSWYIVGAF